MKSALLLSIGWNYLSVRYTRIWLKNDLVVMISIGGNCMSSDLPNGILVSGIEIKYSLISSP